jgi:hypothetical protein
MGSSSKKRQTMGKLARERARKERQALKQERKDERKQAAAARDAQPDDATSQDPSEELVHGE